MLPCLGTMALMLVPLTLVLLSWVPPAAAEEEDLKSPENATVYIVDDVFLLRWDWSGGSVSNVTFSAEYQTPGMHDWEKLPGCHHVTHTTCDFSSVELSVFSKVKLHIRAERGNETSVWHDVDSFAPFQKAQIGPPQVELKPEDKAVTVHLTPPGAEDGRMWGQEKNSFVYSLVIWKNSSHTDERSLSLHPGGKIYKLSPATTYCVKVRASLPLQGKVGTYSAVCCVKTAVENRLPSPENIEVDTKNASFILKWDYPYRNVTFEAQCLRTYLKNIPESHSDRWKQIPGCESVRSPWCVCPQKVFRRGTYFLRVRASNGNETSFWSEVKELDPEVQALVVPPPVISMRPVNRSLHVYVAAPEETGKRPLSQRYPLTYEVVFWENTSNAKPQVLQKTAEFTVPDLEPLTMYCAKARILIDAEGWNKSSVFSEVVCETTNPGSASITWLIAGVCVVLFSIPLVVYVVRRLLRYIKYIFFPSCKPPANINQYFSERSLKNLLLSTSEEQTERCVIIENTDTLSTAGRTDEIDEECRKYSSQSSRDSGNYSNEDENSGSKTSEGLAQREIS